MKKTTSKKDDAKLLDHYDFRGGIRGKYAAQYREGTNVVVIAPDLVEMFPDSKSVNDALRMLADIAKRKRRVVKGPVTKA